jgi:integration host factor subunit beta
MQGEKLTKSDIIDAIYVKSGFNRGDARSLFEMIFAEIKDALVDGKTIELRGIGTFELRIRNGRKKARNPRTGMLTPAYRHRVVAFRPGQELKLAVWKVPEENGSEPSTFSQAVEKKRQVLTGKRVDPATAAVRDNRLAQSGDTFL